MATRKGAKRDEYALEGGAAAKQAKTQESTESAVIGNVDAFCASLKEGPELLLLIRKALNSPDLFTFGELLDVPAVANLRSSEETEDVRHFNLLHLFSYESYSQYASNPRLYGELSHEQERKLRQLSIVSMGARHSRIEYASLKEELQIFDVREMEDLLLDTIYLGLVIGKIDAKSEVFHVDFVIGRDMRNDELVHVKKVLDDWSDRASSLLKAIEDKVNKLRGSIQNDIMERRQLEEKVREISEKLEKTGFKKKGGRGGGDGSEEDDFASYQSFGAGGGIRRRRDRDTRKNV